MADSTIDMDWGCRLKKRFGAEFMEVVQPSRCLLGGGVFGESDERAEKDSRKDQGRLTQRRRVRRECGVEIAGVHRPFAAQGKPFVVLRASRSVGAT